MALVWQESLFAGLPAEGRRAPTHARTASGLTFPGMRRRALDERSWLDVAPGWYPRHAELFEQLIATAPWRQREREMYESVVLEPRLVAGWAPDELHRLPGPVAEIRRAVSARYGVEFDSVLLNLYRDGRDAVAWHGDRVRHVLDEAVVVTIGLGERRRFMLRPGRTGPATVRLTSGEGDFMAMGGRCQHDWQHCVPRAARAGARMSITMRHSGPLPTGGG